MHPVRTQWMESSEAAKTSHSGKIFRPHRGLIPLNNPPRGLGHPYIRLSTPIPQNGSKMNVRPPTGGFEPYGQFG